MLQAEATTGPRRDTAAVLRMNVGQGERLRLCRREAGVHVRSRASSCDQHRAPEGAVRERRGERVMMEMLQRGSSPRAGREPLDLTRRRSPFA